MDRKKFIKNSLLGVVGLAAGSKALKAEKSKTSESTFDKLMDQVGFNHLPNKEIKTMKSVLHKADSRGNANHGWLNSKHSFSFANYHNPERMNFGVLRVLNDDVVAPARGFGRHPHDNMEIISIPLEGDLEHKDSMGNTTVIKEGDVQVMSAGTGVFHSEYNKNGDRDVKFLQIWMFPNQRNVTPRYDQISLDSIKKENELYQVLSPNTNDEGVWVHQNAWFHLGDLNKGKTVGYSLKSTNNGVYVFVLEGDVTVEGQALNKRDGFGVWDTSTIQITADSEAKVLLMDVPMSMS
ncbi:MAG: pirin family protein [Saprospiraceae bacterium]|nr:pirin family protein [Saprospiraceae bacterium]